jgi:predicted nucleotidyltransferase
MAVLADLIERRARKAVHVLSRYARVRAAYIFGSHTTATSDSDSDIDIAAFVEGAEDWDLYRRAEMSALVQKEAGDDVELHFFRAEDLDNPVPGSFASFVLQNGEPIVC